MDNLKVTFEFTVDEAADLKTSREASSWRRIEQFKFVLGLAVMVAVFLILTSDRQQSWASSSPCLSESALALGARLSFGQTSLGHAIRNRTSISLERGHSRRGRARRDHDCFRGWSCARTTTRAILRRSSREVSSPSARARPTHSESAARGLNSGVPYGRNIAPHRGCQYVH